MQSAIDRVFYRDRYDYRRALVGFARELNTDLDLDRLAERLLSRVKDTLDVDRLCLMSGTGYGGSRRFATTASISTPPPIARGAAVAERLAEGHVVRLDDPVAAVRYPAEEVEFWRDTGLYYFVPCVSKGVSIAVLGLGRRENGQPLTTEDIVLLTAMAGQVATSIENARLYKELHLKAAEFDRLRVFNEHILESLDDGLLVVGGDGTVVRWNHALERIYGLRRGEAVGRTLDALFEPAAVAAVQTARAASPNGGTEYRVSLLARGTQSGSRLLVNITTVPLLPMPGREWAGTIVMFEDVTARAHLEEQLRVSERMAALGLLAAGVAHEVNTPLTGISSYTQMLLEQADPDDPRTKLLEKIERQTFRAARIVNGLLNLARPSGVDDGDRTVVDLNTLAADVLALLEHQFDKGRVRVRREFSDVPVMVSGFEFKLQQVFLNLFLNARDAMPSGGWLTIVTRLDGDRAVAEVSDTGVGVSAEYLQRIYDPFFTTKGIGQGTGLGLSISYGIVQEHGGTDPVRECRRTGHAVHPRLRRRERRRVGPVTSAGYGRVARESADEMRRQGSILVIDDEEIMREILETLLSREGYRVRLAASGREGLDLARSTPFDAVIVDVMMPEMDGLQVLDALRNFDDELPVIMITAFASMETAVSAMRKGAFDYITKPFKNDEVLVVLNNAVERRRLVAENLTLKQNLQARYHKFAGIIGSSQQMRQVFDLVIQAAPSRSTILITGESGTGKELVARAIHSNSARSDKSFVTVNSGNLPPDLLESTLFGHVKGAFTGAVYPKKGLFDLADKGSIFFDEIGNISVETQAKLLRVMQEREFMRLGGMETIKVDVRIIAATNVDLKQEMQDGRFREDLFYRLHVISIHLPPLRERKDDIPLLVQHFLEKYGEENARPTLEIKSETLDVLMDYDWPGNVRELENVVERAVVLTPGRVLGPDMIPENVRRAPRHVTPHVVLPPEGISLKDVTAAYERQWIESALEAAGGVQKRAAELLHIKPTTLNEMIKRYDIRPRRKKAANGSGAAAAPEGDTLPEPITSDAD